MKIETQAEENRTLTLTVEVEDALVQPALRSAARRISKDYRIPGFRPGKAPYEVILRHYGEKALYQAAIDDLSQKVYKDMLDQEKIDPIGPGEMDIVELKPMKLKFVVPLRPEVELGDYRSLRLEYAAPAADEAAVEHELQHLREHQAVLEPVERPAQMGDVVTLDAKAFMNDGENPSDFLLADQDVALVLEEKSEWPMPGFTPLVLGIAAGEERKFDLAFPDDYANESLRSKVAHFEVKAKEVKLRTLPEWDDELAKSFGEYENLEALRASVRAQLVDAARRGLDRDYSQKVVDQLVEQATVKFPPMMLESELDDYVKDFDRRLREQKLTLEDYLKIEKKTADEFRVEVRPQAEARLKRALVLGKVVQRESLQIEPGAIEARITELSTPWGDRAAEMRKMLSSDESREMLAIDLLTDKAVERLGAIARGEPVPELEPEAHEHDGDEAGAAEIQLLTEQLIVTDQQSATEQLAAAEQQPSTDQLTAGEQQPATEGATPSGDGVAESAPASGAASDENRPPAAAASE